MKYDICLSAASLFFLIIAMVSTSSRYADSALNNIRFRRLGITLIIALIIDIAGALMINYPDNISVTLSLIINAFGYVSIAVVMYSYAMYIESLVSEGHLNIPFKLLTRAVFWIYLSLHIPNIFTGFMYYFDTTGEKPVYSRGPLYILVYLIPLYIFTYGVATMFINRSRIEKRQFRATLSLLPFAAVGAVLQSTLLSDHLIVLFAVTLGIMVVFFNIEAPDYGKLQEALRETDYANRAKGDFLANMSHEIRTPMNAIVGMCELILRERDISETVREYCFNIQSSGRSLLAIINDILDFSKIESGRMELIEDEFNIASTLNDVINMAVARKGDKALEIVVHVDPDIPRGLIGDEIRIRQIIVNLVTNAIKYSHEGCVSIRVSQKKRDYGINLSVSVSDTGIGITEENLEKLFSSFQQVDTKKNRSVEGTGLGLAISKRLITQMGGFINVTSEYGKGSEFRFVIPLKVSDGEPFIKVRNADSIKAAGYIGFSKFSNEKIGQEYRTLIAELGTGLHTQIELYNSMDELKAALAKGDYTHIFTAREEYCANEEYFLEKSKDAEIILVQDRSDAIEISDGVKCMYKPFYALSAAAVFNNENILTNASERRNSDTRFVAPQARVLIVDDNAINLKVAAGLMRPYHMQILTAESAASAISLLRSKDIHLVFMDHMMPETDGVEATKMIRGMSGDYYKNLPIIALTANAVNGVREMFINSGMNDFIAKPIELSALDRLLRTWLPKELMKAPSDSERYPDDRRASPAAGGDSGSDMFSPETGMFYTGGDEDAYLEILGMYAGKAGEKNKHIQKLFDEKNWKDYIIEVHALKSSSLSIGSKALSERAKELELAGKAGNYSLIEKKNAALLEMYEEVAEMCRKYLAENLPEKEEPHIIEDELEEISAEKLAEHIGKVLAACEAFDDDEAVSICEEVSGYSYNGKALKPLFDEVKAAVSDFEYDEAAAKASAIEEKLKGGEPDA